MIPRFRAWYTPFKGKTIGQEMKYGQAGSLLTHAEMSPDDYKIMQSTGLKDQNGREIFDGDFLTDGEERWIVRYSETECGFTASGVGKSGCWSLYHLANGKKKGRLIEVIGNKYENPELLNLH